MHIWLTHRNDRYIRYRGSRTSNCHLTELNFVGIVVQASSVCPATIVTQVQDTHPSFGRDVNVPSSTYASDPSAPASTYRYGKTRTPIIRSIEPRFGSSLGGTSITIKGIRLPTTVDNAEATINKKPCVVTFAAADGKEIRCTTVARDGFVPPSVFVRHTVDAGGAGTGAGGSVVGSNVGLFRYLDRWSEVNTWLNDEPPGDGDSIIVPLDQTLIMDVQPPRLQVVMVMGVFVFDRQDLHLEAEYIFVKGGRFEIGTEEDPFLQKASDIDDSSTSLFVNSRTLMGRRRFCNGIRGTPPVSSRFGSKLPHLC